MAELRRTEVTDKENNRYEVQLKPIQDKRSRRLSKKVSKKFLVIGLGIFVLVILLVGALVLLKSKDIKETKKESVSGLSSLANKVSFPIYYPDEAKLPRGYTFDASSITSPQPEAILYTITYNQAKKVTFSLQPKVTDNDIQNFYANYIPLRNQMETSYGQAEIGAYNNGPTLQTVVSLPVTNDNTWVIVTAPYDIDQDNLKQILNSLKK